MAIDERSRHELFVRLEEVLEGHANVLMEHLPPVGWADVATKRDLDALALAAKRDLDQLEERLEMKLDARFAQVDARFDQMAARFDARFEQMAARFGARFEQMEARLDRSDALVDTRFEAAEHRLMASFRAEMIAQTRIMVFGLAAAFVGVAGVVLAGGRLP